jgi:hypothetical protein
MTISLRLTRGQRRRMKRLLQKTRSRIEALRARIMLLLHEGHEPSAAAAITGCARATVYRTLYRFEELGEEAVFDQRQRRKPTKSASVERTPAGYIDRSPQDLGWGFRRCGSPEPTRPRCRQGLPISGGLGGGARS